MSAVTSAPPADALPAGHEDWKRSRRGHVADRAGIALLYACAPGSVLYLSFNNGGFFPTAPGLLSIGLVAALVLRTTLAEHPFEGHTRGTLAVTAGLALFAGLQLASALWSHNSARALDNYEQTLVYLLGFSLFASIPRTDQRLRWMIRLLAAATTFICLAAATSRLLPSVWPTTTDFFSDRLSYPLGYWNALGLMAGMATVLLAQLTSSTDEPAIGRVAAAACIPVTLVTLLLTYSRGAIGACVLAVALFLVVARPRLAISGLLAAVPPAAVALKAAYDATALSASNPISAAAVSQGRHVAAVTGACVGGAALARALLLLFDVRIREGWPPAVRRVPWRWITGALAAAAAIVLIAVGAPHYVGHQFYRYTHVDASITTSQTRDRLTVASGNGRLALWRVALQEYRAHKLGGGGAGTFESYYAAHRPDQASVRDTHSLYLQTLAENGLVGLLVLVAALGAILAALAVRSRGLSRTYFAAMLATAVAWAVHAAVDWDWQLPAVTLPVFIMGALALSRRTPGGSGRVEAAPRNRTLLALGLLVLAVGPLLIGQSYQRIRSSGEAFTAGDCQSAKRDALSSISLLAVRPDAYEIIGYCDLLEGFPVEGLAAMRKAESLEPLNWNYHYGLAIAQAENQIDPLPEARRALQLNPQLPIVRDAVTAFGGASTLQLPAAGQRMYREGRASGQLSVLNL